MRDIEKKKGIDPDIRFMNDLIKNEAEDNGISADQIKTILSKFY